MKITVIYGTERKSSTYNIARQFIGKLSSSEEDIVEFFLPRDLPNFCRGCGQCFLKDKSKCVDYKYVEPILKAIEQCDLIIFATPVFVYHVTGQMKAFLDHFAFQWMIHRPNESMFKKQALIISTAAGAGTKSAMKDISDSLWYWGVGRTYKYGINVRATNWNEVSDNNVEKINRDVNRISNKILKERSKNSPSLKVKFLFYAMRIMHKKIELSKSDKDYWTEKDLGNKLNIKIS